MTRMHMAAVMVAMATGSAAFAQGVELKGAGATFPAPLYAKWVDAYNKANTGARVDYQSVGSGAGIKAITERNVQFGASDAPLSDAQLEKAPAKLVHVPTVAGAVVLTYNLPAVKGDLKLNAETISGIYLGQITKWSDAKLKALNPEAALPDQDIVVVRRSDGSGTTYIFTDYLAKVSPEWVKTVGKASTSVKWPVGLGAKGNDGVAQNVQNSMGAIGYVEQAYAANAKMAYATVVNAEGEAVRPTAEAISSALENAAKEVPADLRISITNAAGKASYPIAGVTYLLVYQDLGYLNNAAQAAALVKFLKWATTDAQAMAGELGYTALPKAIQEKISATLDTIVTGAAK